MLYSGHELAIVHRRYLTIFIVASLWPADRRKAKGPDIDHRRVGLALSRN